MEELSLKKRELEASEDLFFKETRKLILQVYQRLEKLSDDIPLLKELTEGKQTERSKAALQILTKDSEDTLTSLEAEIEIIEGQLTDEIVGNLNKFQKNTYLHDVKKKFQEEIKIIDDKRKEIQSRWEEFKEKFTYSKDLIKSIEETKTIFTNLAELLNVEKIDKLLLRQNLANLWLEAQEKGVLKMVLAMSNEAYNNPKVIIYKNPDAILNGNNLVEGASLSKIKFEVVILIIHFQKPHANYYSDYTNHAWNIQYNTNIDKFQIKKGASDHGLPNITDLKETTDTFHEALEYIITQTRF